MKWNTILLDPKRNILVRIEPMEEKMKKPKPKPKPRPKPYPKVYGKLYGVRVKSSE